MNQRFRVDMGTKREFSNGAIGYGPGGPFDCLGPHAKIVNCPIHGTNLRLTCYATNYADTFFSIPACTQYKRKYVHGYFASDGDGGVVFHVMDRHKERVGL